MGLPSDKMDKLRLLLSSLPADMTDRLVRVARHGDPPMGRLLEFCAAPLDVAVRRRVFRPLAPISGAPGADRPSRCLTPEPMLDRIWAWLAEEHDPALVERACAIACTNVMAPPKGQMDEVRLAVAASIEAAVKAAEADPKAAKKLRARLDVDNFAPVLRAAAALRATPALRAALAGLPDPIVDLTEGLTVTIRDQYEAAAAADPDAGLWALFMVMARLDRPWRILRVFERIARREDDLLVSQTDMAHLGDALLSDAEHHLTGFAHAPATSAEAADAAQALADFAAVTVGMTREIGIRKEGPWGKRMFELRAKASAQMEVIHKVARDVIRRATPEALNGKGKPKSKDGENLPERAAALCRFLRLTRDDAARAAVGGAHASLMDELAERLESAGQKVLDGLRAGGDPAAGAQRLADIAALMKAIGNNEAGDILLRRSAAAQAA